MKVRILSVAAAVVALVGFAGSEILAQAAPKDNLSDVLELRGYTRIGGVLEFSVYNKEKKRSEWLRVDKEREGYRIESYDADTNAIVVRYQNRRGILHLHGSRIVEYSEKAAPGSTDPASASPARTEPRRTAATLGNRPLPNLPPRPATEPPTSPSNRVDSPGPGGSPQSSFVSRRSSAERESGDSPSAPGTPSTSNPSAPNEDSSGTDSPADSYWANASSPPPIPPGAPPAYSPDE